MNCPKIKNICANYLQSIAKKFKFEETSEMGYRTEFEIFLKDIFEQIKVRRIDHDPKAKAGNKPDFVVIMYDIPILYIETKNIGVTLDKIESSKQMIRYYGYTNLVLTDYIEFRFYRNGLTYEEPIKIADYNLKSRTISPLPDNYEHLAKTLIDFTKSHKEPIKSGEHLAKIMAGKAQRIRDNAKAFLSNQSEKNAEITRIYRIIKKLLVHDLTKNSFADMYAQTLVYGLFVARYYDKTPENFTRQEARDLVPASNPFLRHFFDHIVGPDFDKRLEYIVDELCFVFSHSNVSELMKQYFKNDIWGKSHAGPDPVIHFYEDFLNEYDPKLRKKLGAYYTPLPVVRFIVRTVDYLLIKDFDLVSGLADTSKLPNGTHRVQILDPAVGTGTFISAIIRIIYERLRNCGQKGRWPKYVHHDLLPRLHGFELMMAPYTIAHLKLSMAFKATGFWNFHRRLGIYLTNSLEESSIMNNLFAGFGFAESIAVESREASVIKNATPIMVVIGNPPYSVSSSNKGEWIQNLVRIYKTDLKERNIQPLSDDYIKFIRFAEHFVEKNKSGIIAMITNNTYIDGIIHRQMRKQLMKTFDDIYILDLHGNLKKREKTPDGDKDENVFPIQQGVAISLFVLRSTDNKTIANVYHSEIYGRRDDKFKKLNSISIQNIEWNKLEPADPYYFFVPKDFRLKEEYYQGFRIDELFFLKTTGIKTHHDNELVSFNPFESKFNARYLYRPFDYRYIDYNLQKVERHRFKIMKHVLNHTNVSLITSKQFGGGKHFILFVANTLHDISSQPFAAYYNFPLYLYSEDGSRTLNLNQEIVNQIEKFIGKTTPEDIFDYIYAILHSSSYREKYKEFLKINFPRVPYPKNIQSFKKMVALGSELRSLHLLESPKVSDFLTTYPVVGSDKVEKVVYKNGKVFINSSQYFGNVPRSIWNFYISGYQPAQKWLKDRRNKILTNDDIEHYQKIIMALVETEKIMMEIDKHPFV